MPLPGIRHVVLQKKLDFLDEVIDTLELEKAEAGDDDLPGDIAEAKEALQMAREAYGRGELQEAWLLAERAEYCASVFGRIELESWSAMMTEIVKATK